MNIKITFYFQYLREPSYLSLLYGVSKFNNGITGNVLYYYIIALYDCPCRGILIWWMEKQPLLGMILWLATHYSLLCMISPLLIVKFSICLCLCALRSKLQPPLSTYLKASPHMHTPGVPVHLSVSMCAPWCCPLWRLSLAAGPHGIPLV